LPNINKSDTSATRACNGLTIFFIHLVALIQGQKFIILLYSSGKSQQISATPSSKQTLTAIRKTEPLWQHIEK
jgi:hypothetical protein